MSLVFSVVLFIYVVYKTSCGAQTHFYLITLEPSFTHVLCVNLNLVAILSTVHMKGLQTFQSFTTELKLRNRLQKKGCVNCKSIFSDCSKILPFPSVCVAVQIT